MSRKNLVKEILYRSIHRGCKETDHLIGGFAKEKIEQLSDIELCVFKELISEDDLSVYDWILGKEKTPQKYFNMIKKMQQFHNL
ncbi:MAG TPA: succinate dehydrogenase assembly factor 2 [Rickettsiales bacterium]|nr:succinate dehydrogenase assembly factor 2 [Rickettsiales bacterium]